MANDTSTPRHDFDIDGFRAGQSVNELPWLYLRLALCGDDQVAGMQATIKKAGDDLVETLSLSGCAEADLGATAVLRELQNYLDFKEARNPGQAIFGFRRHCGPLRPQRAGWSGQLPSILQTEAHLRTWLSENDKLNRKWLSARVQALARHQRPRTANEWDAWVRSFDLGVRLSRIERPEELESGLIAAFCVCGGEASDSPAAIVRFRFNDDTRGWAHDVVDCEDGLSGYELIERSQHTIDLLRSELGDVARRFCNELKIGQTDSPEVEFPYWSVVRKTEPPEISSYQYERTVRLVESLGLAERLKTKRPADGSERRSLLTELRRGLIGEGAVQPLRERRFRAEKNSQGILELHLDRNLLATAELNRSKTDDGAVGGTAQAIQLLNGRPLHHLTDQPGINTGGDDNNTGVDDLTWKRLGDGFGQLNNKIAKRVTEGALEADSRLKFHMKRPHVFCVLASDAD